MELIRFVPCFDSGDGYVVSAYRSSLADNCIEKVIPRNVAGLFLNLYFVSEKRGEFFHSYFLRFFLRLYANVHSGNIEEDFGIESRKGKEFVPSFVVSLLPVQSPSVLIFACTKESSGGSMERIVFLLLFRHYVGRNPFVEFQFRVGRILLVEFFYGHIEFFLEQSHLRTVAVKRAGVVVSGVVVSRVAVSGVVVSRVAVSGVVVSGVVVSGVAVSGVVVSGVVVSRVAVSGVAVSGVVVSRVAVSGVVVSGVVRSGIGIVAHILMGLLWESVPGRVWLHPISGTVRSGRDETRFVVYDLSLRLLFRIPYRTIRNIYF